MLSNSCPSFKPEDKVLVRRNPFADILFYKSHVNVREKYEIGYGYILNHLVAGYPSDFYLVKIYGNETHVFIAHASELYLVKSHVSNPAEIIIL